MGSNVKENFKTLYATIYKIAISVNASSEGAQDPSPPSSPPPYPDISTVPLGLDQRDSLLTKWVLDPSPFPPLSVVLSGGKRSTLRFLE